MNIRTALFLILFAAGSLQAQTGFSSGRHDSLLFDGGNSNISFYNKCYSCTRDDKCIITVWSVKGSVIGTVIRDTIIPGGCMIMDTATVCERKQLSASDELKPGDTIFTGPDGYVELRVKSLKGTYIRTSESMSGVARTDLIRIGPSSTVEAGCIPFMIKGKIWLRESADEVGKSINESIDKAIESVRSKLMPKGTTYTLEIEETEDIVKVYEGSVEINLKKYDNSEVKNNSEELKKLTDDYQNGKISAEEMIKKSKELADKMKYSVNDFKTKITVEAGNRITVSGKFGEVTPIGTDDDKWWSEENFK